MKKLVRESLEESSEREFLDKIRKQILDILQTEAEDADPIDVFDVEDNLDTTGKYKIEIEMDTFGMDDIFTMQFIYDKNENLILLKVFSLDSTNMVKREFEIKTPTLNAMIQKLEAFWDIYAKKERNLSRRQAEEWGY